ncbi:unnamed protein product [Phytophthora fragariaefolia]|uniref:Unnamed protein product n=1 Tax=Phytophthora fragariaefolia TaxID=1490495 RepID=A0A9W6XYE7_9STRA|nr:unnamed protein product [Phytophthora fragariaefolia]
MHNGFARQQRDPPRGSIAIGEAGNDSPSGLVAKIYGRDRMVFSRQQICDDLLSSLPKLHAALRSNPSRNERVWRRTSRAGSRVKSFELVGVPRMTGAPMAAKCTTMEALNGKRFEGGEVLYRERCRLKHNNTSNNESQALLGVQMAALRPSWKTRLNPSHFCRPEHQNTQRLCFSSLTYRYPGSDRAVHVMKTLPKRIHDQIIPRDFRSALRQDADHLGVAFDIETQAVDTDEGSTQITRIFVYAYVAAPRSESSFKDFPGLDSHSGHQRSLPRNDWDQRGPCLVTPEAKHVVELLIHQLSKFEQVIRRRRFGFQSFMLFQPSSTSDAASSSFSQLRTVCQICLKRFNLLRRELYCQICGHPVCGECSQLCDVETQMGDVRENRVCLNCVIRVDSCTFSDEDIIAALGPTVVPLRRRTEWLQLFENDEFGGEILGDDIETASESSDVSCIGDENEEDKLPIQVYSKDQINCSESLVQLGQILSDSKQNNRCRGRSRGRSSISRKKSVTKDSIHGQLEGYVNRSLRHSQDKFPVRNLKTAKLIHDYRYTFDASRTTYDGHPVPPVPVPAREARRLHHIQASGILEPEYDHSALNLLAQVAATRLKCPVESMCSHTVYVDKPLIVKNAHADLRFAQLPVVRDFGIRFYTGFPIRAPDSSIVASLCTSDRVPHGNISTADYAIMQTLADIASQIIAPRGRVINIPRQPRPRASSNCRTKQRWRSRSHSQGKQKTTVTTISRIRHTGAEGMQLDTIYTTRTDV